jgi:hypothetical protein
MNVLRFVTFLLLACSLKAGNLPSVPPSDRVLSTEEVKNYWLNAIPKKKLPPKANGLHPEDQAHRERVIQQRKNLMQQVRQGVHDTDAKLATLAHNVDAHTKRGEDQKAKHAEERLFALREHLSKLATLEVQRETARKLAEAHDQIAGLESEISALRQTISSQTCTNGCD